MDTTSPHLPLELESVIFSIAYQNDHRDAKTLILIANRVFEWLIPNVFSIVKLSEDPELAFPIKFNKSAFQKHGHHVRHLWLASTDLQKYLNLFPNVIDLVWRSNKHTDIDYSTVRQLPLTHADVPFKDGLIPVFKNLTHLHLHTIRLSNLSKPDIFFPKLTHLCVTYTSSTTAVLQKLLVPERSPRLRVVIIRRYRRQALTALKWNVTSPVNDQRVVMIRTDVTVDWERGARGEVDMWRFAEAIVEERMK